MEPNLEQEDFNPVRNQLSKLDRIIKINSAYSARNHKTSQYERLESENQQMRIIIENLKNQVETNKTFMYMVIHDLKHPTESMISQLAFLQTQIQDQASKIERLRKQSLNLSQTINKIKSKNIKFDQNQKSNYPNFSRSEAQHKDKDKIKISSPEIFEHNLPRVHRPIQKSKLFQEVEVVNPNRLKRQLKVQMLHDELDNFFQTHLVNLGYLVDGSRHNFSFTIEHSEESESCIKAVSTSLLKSESENQNTTQNEENDILPKLKKMQHSINLGQDPTQQLVEEVNNFSNKLEESHSELFRQVETVSMMKYSSEIMYNLMMDLLDLAQMENSAFKLNQGFFSMFDAIKSAFGVVQHTADKKQVKLELKPIIDIEMNYYTALYGDRSRFQQVLINFLSNSLKFSSKNSKVFVFLKMLEKQILLSSDQEMKQLLQQPLKNKKKSFKSKNEQKKSLNLEVKKSLIKSWDQRQILLKNELDQQEESKQEKMNIIQDQQEVEKDEERDSTCYIKFELGIQDFGCGIPADKIKDLFINFNSLDQHRKQNPTGRGLGLSICKKIIESMGGAVKVYSQEGIGSTFSIIFKVMCKVNEQKLCDSPQRLECSLQSIQQQFSVKDKDENKPFVLFVNDDPFLLWGYQQQLQPFFNIVTAENGLQAVQIVQSHSVSYFDAIILDINMPIMDGYEACQLIYQNFLEISSMKAAGKLDCQKPKIYALTSDCSEETDLLIKQYPFDRKFTSLQDMRQVKLIMTDIKEGYNQQIKFGVNLNRNQEVNQGGELENDGQMSSQEVHDVDQEESCNFVV